jgi:hypothetical protein
MPTESTDCRDNVEITVPVEGVSDIKVQVTDVYNHKDDVSTALGNKAPASHADGMAIPDQVFYHTAVGDALHIKITWNTKVGNAMSDHQSETDDIPVYGRWVHDLSTSFVYTKLGEPKFKTDDKVMTKIHSGGTLLFPVPTLEFYQTKDKDYNIGFTFAVIPGESTRILPGFIFMVGRPSRFSFNVGYCAANLDTLDEDNKGTHKEWQGDFFYGISYKLLDY